MPVQATCPHCATPCLIGEQWLGQVVRCFKCAQLFRMVAPSPPPRRVEPASTIDADDLLMPTFDVEPPSARRLGLTLDIGGATTTGKVRRENEDAVLIRRQSLSRGDAVLHMVLLAVVDGMGGYGGGAQASLLARQALHGATTPWFDASLTGQPVPRAPADILRASLNEASKVVLAAAQANVNWKGMGAAAVVGLLAENIAHVVHVGDCRAYHVRDGEVRQLTKDQTLVQRMIDLGQLKPHEAARHPARSELSQALGRRPDVTADYCQLTLNAGDWLILASDGLHAHVDAADLRKEVELATAGATKLAQRLVELADQRGGTDNCTVIAVRVD